MFENNKSIVLINNTKAIPKKRFPTEFYSWYYKRYLYFRDENRTVFPKSVPLFNSSYLFITRGWGGWNNIYHHTEWIHNLLRYVHHASALPRVSILFSVYCRWRTSCTILTRFFRMQRSETQKDTTNGPLITTTWRKRLFRPLSSRGFSKERTMRVRISPFARDVAFDRIG